MSDKPDPTGLAFLDIETSGLDPFYNDIMEVGIVLADFAGAHEEDFEFSLPFNVHRANAKALEVNGYSTGRQFAPIVEISEGAHILKNTLWGRIVVANNVVFDLTFIQVYLNKLSIGNPWHYASVELKSMMAGALNLAPPWSSTLLADRIGVPLPDNRHSALADATWNYEVYKALGLQSDYQ